MSQLAAYIPACGLQVFMLEVSLNLGSLFVDMLVISRCNNNGQVSRRVFFFAENQFENIQYPNPKPFTTDA